MITHTGGCSVSDEAQGLAQWLREQGQSEKNIAAHQKGLAMLRAIEPAGMLLPRHVDMALRQEENNGASGQRLANLQKIGDRVVQFSRERGAEYTLAAPPPASAGGLALDVAVPARPSGTMARAPASDTGPKDWRSFKHSSERCGCENSELFLDDGADLLMKLAGGSGMFGFVVFYLVGLLGGLGTLAGLLALSFFVSSITVRYRCMTCRASCAPDDRDDAMALHAARLKYFVLAGIAAAASIALWLWWWQAVKASVPPPPQEIIYYY